jgi:cytochrome c-type biogenesis protein
MKIKTRFIITGFVTLLTVAVFAWKHARTENGDIDNNVQIAPDVGLLPCMVELGSTTCVPCKMMEEVLESLRHKYSHQLQVDFVDVTVSPDVGKKYKIKLIPTQIFFDASGKELFRHEGFFAEKDIVAKLKLFGIILNSNMTDTVDDKNSSGQNGLIFRIFSSLTTAVSGSALIALSAAFIWGVLSILLSPCHLASIPLIVGFINDQEKMTTKRAFLLAFLFAAGILITIAVIGTITAVTGNMLGDLGTLTNYIVAVIFILIGLHLFDVIPMPWNGPGQVKMKSKGFLASLILGLVFGIAIGPCTFAYMAPMLAIVFKTSSTNMVGGIFMLLFYGIGHCSVIVFAGTFTEWIQKYLNWNEESHGAMILKKICAVLVIIAGFYLIYIS